MDITKVQSSENLYEKKVPYTTADEYGNEATLYRKDIFTKEQRLSEKNDLQNRLNEIQADIDTIEELES